MIDENSLNQTTPNLSYENWIMSDENRLNQTTPNPS